MKIVGIVVITLSILLITSSACKKKCKETELATFSFSSGDKKLIPYNGADLLVVNYNNGHHDSLKGTGRLDDFYRVYKSSSDKDCSDYYNIEYNRYYFPTILINNSALLIELVEEITDPTFSYGQKFFGIRIGATYEPGCFYAENFLFKNDSIFVNNSNVHFYDSIALGSKVFYLVYELKERYPPSLTSKYDKVYYNNLNGIVALIDNGGKIVYVNKVE